MMFLLIIALTVGGSFYLRTRTVGTTIEEQYQNFSTVHFEGPFYNFGPFRANDFNIYQDVESIDELVEKSLVIARVHFVKRQQKYASFYTTVKVEEIYQGQLENQEIVIFEPITIREDILSIEGVHKPMDDQQDYIVFLQGAIPEDNQHFNLVNSCVGLIPVKEQLYVKKLKSTETNTESISIDRKTFEKYDFFDLYFDSLDGNLTEDDEVYENTKQLFYNHYHSLLKKYVGIDGKIIFEDE